MKKKLLLINPVTHGKTQSSFLINDSIFSPVPPLSLGIIAALTPKHWEVEIFDEIFERFSYRKADMVGFTSYTASANRAYQIAAAYRDEGIPTVMGGIHASMLPGEALKFVDTVVIGEAESVWGKVICDFESGSLQKIYRGERLPMEGAPVPRRDLFSPGYMMASVQTTRGCPMDCDFCSVSVFNGREYRKRPVEEVLDELQVIPQKRLFFLDDNLVGKGEEGEKRAISLFKGMIERKLDMKWGCQASINVADNEEVLYYASKSGCKIMLIGIESEKEHTLASLGKKMNISKLSRYNETFKLINKHKIAIIGTFIFGTDTDTIEDLHCRTQYIRKSRVNVMQPAILTPYPGTAIYEKYKDSGRLLYTDYPGDWDKYDMTEVLYKPALMTPEELKITMISCWRSLGNRWNVFFKFIKTLIFTKSLLTGITVLYANIVYRTIMMKKVNEQKLRKKSGRINPDHQ